MEHSAHYSSPRRLWRRNDSSMKNANFPFSLSGGRVLRHRFRRLSFRRIIRAEKCGHFGLTYYQVEKSGLGEHIFNHGLQGTPQAPDRAVLDMGAYRFNACVPLTEVLAEYAPAKEFDHFRNRDLARWTRQSVPTGLPPGARDKSSKTKQPHKLGHIRHRQSFRTADLRNAEALTVAMTRHEEQAPETVFLLSA